MRRSNKFKNPVGCLFILCVFLGYAALAAILLFIIPVNDFLKNIQGVIGIRGMDMILLITIAFITLAGIIVVKVPDNNHSKGKL